MRVNPELAEAMEDEVVLAPMETRAGEYLITSTKVEREITHFCDLFFAVYLPYTGKRAEGYQPWLGRRKKNQEQYQWSRLRKDHSYQWGRMKKNQYQWGRL